MSAKRNTIGLPGLETCISNLHSVPGFIVMFTAQDGISLTQLEVQHAVGPTDWDDSLTQTKLWPPDLGVLKVENLLFVPDSKLYCLNLCNQGHTFSSNKSRLQIILQLVLLDKNPCVAWKFLCSIFTWQLTGVFKIWHIQQRHSTHACCDTTDST